MQAAAMILGILLLIAGASFVVSRRIPDLPRVADEAATTRNEGASGAPTGTPPVDSSNPARTLDRSGQGLTSLPRDIVGMTNLRELDLSDNEITETLPAEIRFLQDLEVLDLSGNRMTNLPAEVGQLSKLRILDLSDNRFTGLPHEIGNLQDLRELRLSGNDISPSDRAVIRGRLPTTTIFTP